MADVKWIKIVTDIFDDEKILLIETLPEGDSIIVIWFKLLCLAGKQNNSGVFMLNDKIPYTDKMLSSIFRRKETTIQLALKTFEQFGMVEIVDDVITIPNWGKHQNLDQLEAKKEYMRNYMQKYRTKQVTLIDCKANSKSNSKANVSQADKDIDIDIDKDIESIGKENSLPTSPIKSKFKKYGEYFHVKLTDEQYQKLISDYSESKILEYIKKVDEYCQQYGKSYKDYNLTIRNWLNKDKGQQPKKESSFDMDKFETLANRVPKVRPE